MAKWQRILDLTSLWEELENGEKSVQDGAKEIALLLSQLQPFSKKLIHIDDYKNDLIEHFESLADDESADVDDFDFVMNELYDWGDITINDPDINAVNKKLVCWISTF